MSERLTTLGELDIHTKRLNSKKLAVRKSADRSKIEQGIKSLTNELGKDVAQNNNKRAMLYTIMKEILVSEKGLTLKRGDNVSYINALLPKGYHIDFNNDAKKADGADTIKIVDKDLVLIKKGKEQIVIGKVTEWGSTAEETEVSESEKKVEITLTPEQKYISDIFSANLNTEAKPELSKVNPKELKQGGKFEIRGVQYEITEVKEGEIIVKKTSEGETQTVTWKVTPDKLAKAQDSF